MDWQAIGAIGELAGAVAVVLTIGYLAAQVRSANKQAQADSYSALVEGHVSHHRTIASRPEIAQIFADGLLDLDALAPRERQLFHSFIAPIVLNFQKYRRHHELGLIPKDTFEMFETDVVATLLAPGGRQWWEESKGKFSEVADYLDARIQALEGHVVPSHLDFGGTYGSEGKTG